MSVRTYRVSFNRYVNSATAFARSSSDFFLEDLDTSGAYPSIECSCSLANLRALLQFLW